MLEQTRQPHTPDGAPGLLSKRTLEPGPALGDLPDLLLVERARGRDIRALETLIRRYNRRLFRIARSVLSDEESAEEAVHAAHIRAFSNLDRYEPAGKFGAWLARVAFNEALTLRRHVSSVPGAVNFVHASTSKATPAPATGEAPEAIAARQLLEAAIDALPEVFRTVLVLRTVEELSGVEVAACLGLNEITVRTRLYRALQRLKQDVAQRLRAEPHQVFELTPARSDHIVELVFARLRTAASPGVTPEPAR